MRNKSEKTKARNETKHDDRNDNTITEQQREGQTSPRTMYGTTAR